jgi:hypothetical protein
MKLPTLALLTALFPAMAFAQSGPFTMIQGSVGGTSTIILLNTATGDTWFLDQMGKDGRPLPFPAGAAGGVPIWVRLSAYTAATAAAGAVICYDASGNRVQCAPGNERPPGGWKVEQVDPNDPLGIRNQK